MAKSNIITGLDIGTSNTRVVVASYKEGEEKPKIIGVGEVPSSGMRKGIVVDIDEVTESIKKAIEQASLSSGFSIDHVYLSIGGNHISVRENKGLVAVSRADQEVSEEDISRVIDSASAISLPPNREIIHVIPKTFKLDNEEDIQDPLGMTGARLEVDTIIIDGLAPHIKNLTKCVSGLGIKIDGLALNVLAASQSVLSKRQKELGVLVLDLGGGTASMVVYEEGKLLHAHVLPVGSSHITNDIAIGLRTTIDLAERVKLQYGLALPSEVKKKEIINLSELDENEEGEIDKKEVAKIIEARVCEIFDLVNKELKKLGKQKLLPAGVILVGGGSLLPSIVDLAKQELGLPAEIGIPSEVEGIMEGIDDPAFATATGLVLWGLRMGEGSNQKSILSEIPSASTTINKIKGWFRAFLP
jgi:cell division protein FtsA